MGNVRRWGALALLRRRPSRELSARLPSSLSSSLSAVSPLSTALSLSLALSISLSLSGCADHVQRPEDSITPPPSWQASTTLEGAQPSWPDAEWWKSFGDPSLDQLEHTALAGNFSLQAAASRVAEAQAIARIAGAKLYPKLDAKASAERVSDFSGDVMKQLHTADLAAVYDPDLAGRLRNLARAKEALVIAAAESQAGVALGVSAEVASTYFQLAALGERLELLSRTVDTARRIDALVETRYRGGAVSELDHAQSKTSLAELEAQFPPLEEARQQTLHALAILIGRLPAEPVSLPPPLTRIAPPTVIPVGLPSELLYRRPDLLKEEAKLAAAHADIRAARAALFPSLRLTAEGGYESNELVTLIRSSSGVVALGADVVAPIFHWGALRARVERENRRYEALLHDYQQTVLDALREVEDALVAIQKLSEQERLLDAARRQSQRAFELAEIRYRGGATDATTMLLAQNTALRLEDSLLQVRLAHLQALVSLYRALGGGATPVL